MALATSVTGPGRLISSQYEGMGKVWYFRTEKVDGEEVVNKHYVFFTESRVVRKWYALTESAATAYLAAHPELNISVDCVNEKLGAYELTTSAVERTEFKHTVTPITEGP
jgi:hypothetical protein